jgi:hypothetical protein
MKLCPVGAELFHTDRLTDRHVEDNSRLSCFSELAQKQVRLQSGFYLLT